MKSTIEISPRDIQNIIKEHVERMWGINLSDSDLKIKSRTKDDNRADWHEADIKVTIIKYL